MHYTIKTPCFEIFSKIFSFHKYQEQNGGNIMRRILKMMGEILILSVLVAISWSKCERKQYQLDFS